MIKTLKLKTKISLSIIVSAIFLTLLITVSLYFYLNKKLVNEKIINITDLGIEQVEESDLIFKNNLLFAEMIGGRTRVVEYLSNPTKDKQEEITNIFSSYAKKDNKYLALYLLDKKGKALVSTDPAFIGQDYSFRSYYKEGMKGNSYIDLLLGKTSNQFGYYFSYPVFDEKGNIIGIFVSKVSNQEIDSNILKSRASQENTIMLVDKYGVVLSSNKPDRFLKSIGELTEIEKKELVDSQKYLTNEIKSLQYNQVQELIRIGEISKTMKIKDKEDGETEIININKIGNFPFYLISEVGLETISGLIMRLIIILLLLIFFGVIIAGYILYKLILYTLSPLKEFKFYTEKISSGDFSQKMEINTKDEIGDLAQSFNYMTSELNNLYINLDKKVEEQTKEVSNKSKELEEQKLAIMNVLEDVEEEKNKTELLAKDLEKFKLAVDNASDQVIITDNEGIVIYGNRAVERITGFKPEEAMGKKAGTLWKAPMPNEYYEDMWYQIKDQKKVFISEIKNKRKNGEFYIANISISPVIDNEDEVIYYVAIEHDISKEKEIDKAKTEFVSLASHQLRTPLSSINWYTEMLLNGDAGKINTEQKKYLNEVAIGNQRMVDLVDSLLNVSCLDLGTFIIEPEAVNIKEMSQSVVNELKPQIIAKKIKIEEKYDSNLGEFKADRKLLRMVFQNILSNAVKYTKNEGIINLEILNLAAGDKFGQKEIEKDSLTIKISDSGMGIPASQKDKIFSKMFRADNARESETEGTGLGLYIIQSIVNQSGGLIWFESEENVGTTFYVVFPLSGMKKKEGDKKLD